MRYLKPDLSSLYYQIHRFINQRQWPDPWTSIKACQFWNEKTKDTHTQTQRAGFNFLLWVQTRTKHTKLLSLRKRGRSESYTALFILQSDTLLDKNRETHEYIFFGQLKNLSWKIDVISVAYTVCILLIMGKGGNNLVICKQIFSCSCSILFLMC